MAWHGRTEGFAAFGVNHTLAALRRLILGGQFAEQINLPL